MSQYLVIVVGTMDESEIRSMTFLVVVGTMDESEIRSMTFLLYEATHELYPVEKDV